MKFKESRIKKKDKSRSGTYKNENCAAWGKDEKNLATFWEFMKGKKEK